MCPWGAFAQDYQYAARSYSKPNPQEVGALSIEANVMKRTITYTSFMKNLPTKAGAPSILIMADVVADFSPDQIEYSCAGTYQPHDIRNETCDKYKYRSHPTHPRDPPDNFDGVWR